MGGKALLSDYSRAAADHREAFSWDSTDLSGQRGTRLDLLKPHRVVTKLGVEAGFIQRFMYSSKRWRFLPLKMMFG